MVTLTVILFSTKCFLLVYTCIDRLKLKTFKLFVDSDADVSWLLFLKKPTCWILAKTDSQTGKYISHDTTFGPFLCTLLWLSPRVMNDSICTYKDNPTCFIALFHCEQQMRGPSFATADRIIINSFIYSITTNSHFF